MYIILNFAFSIIITFYADQFGNLGVSYSTVLNDLSVGKIYYSWLMIKCQVGHHSCRFNSFGAKFIKKKQKKTFVPNSWKTRIRTLNTYQTSCYGLAIRSDSFIKFKSFTGNTFLACALLRVSDITAAISPDFLFSLSLTSSPFFS